MDVHFLSPRPPATPRCRTSILLICYTFTLAIIIVSGNDSRVIYQRDREACRCDDSISSLLWGYCLECICIGTHFYYRGFNRRESKLDYFWRTGAKVFGTVDFIPRGGSVEAEDGVHDNEQHSETQPKSESTNRQFDQATLPLIDAETVSLALRLTCETNRRLYRGTLAVIPDSISKSRASAAANHAPQPGEQQIVHHPPVNVRMPLPDGSIAKPVQVVSGLERAEERRKEEFTIFHASEPWVDDIELNLAKDNSKAERRGVLRWGPDLKEYLDTLLSAIGLENTHVDSDASTSTVSTHSTKKKQPTTPLEDERQLILTLTIMYLDHATSLESNRHVDPNTGHPWYPSCPYAVPQTVHRLVLTAMSIATKSIRGDADVSNSLRDAANSLLPNNAKKSAISQTDLQQMEQWMISALGGGPSHNHHHYHHYESNWQISPDEIHAFIRKWGETFYPERLKARDERSRSRLERLERFWNHQTSLFGGYGNSGYGADHGHGNHVVGWEGQHAGYGMTHQSSYYEVQHDEQVEHFYNKDLYQRVGFEAFGHQQ
jgi:hypothetical protein